MLAVMFIMTSITSKGQVLPPTGGFSISCPGTIASGNQFKVTENYNYSNVVGGNVIMTLTYDNSKVDYLSNGGSSFVPVITGTIGGIRTLTFTMPITLLGLDQSFIECYFIFKCPSNCLSTNISAAFTGNILIPGMNLITATPCTTNSSVTNTWSGSNDYVNGSYDCVNNTATFVLTVQGSLCFQINHPTVKITPSIGTVISSRTYVGNIYTLVGSNTVAGNNITLCSDLIPQNRWYIYYTVQVPCGTTAPSLIKTDAQLFGDNCGPNNNSLVTFNQASFAIPTATTLTATLPVSLNNTQYNVSPSNTGSTPMNVTLTTIIPLVKINSITLLNGSTASISLYDCSGNLINTYTTFPITNPPLLSKAVYTINNILSGQTVTMNFQYDKTNSCNGINNNDCVEFNTSGDYTSNVTSVACNCTILPSVHQANIKSIYCLHPELFCHDAVNFDFSECYEPDDTLKLWYEFKNCGSSALINGQLSFQIDPNLVYLGNLKLNGIPIVNSTISANLLTIQLPNNIPSNCSVYRLSFDTKVSSTATSNWHPTNTTMNISGSNLDSKSIFSNTDCASYFTICIDPHAEVEKTVSGDNDGGSFSQNGSGSAGSFATYRINVKNTGNIAITDIELVDRMPCIGDKAIASCASRNSQFNMILANNPLTPSSLNSNIKYSQSISTNNLPNTWSSIVALPTSCNNFSNVFNSTFTLNDNTIKINLPSPIPPFGNYSFDIKVKIDPNAITGEKVCNSIAIRCYTQNADGSKSDLKVNESNLACLTVTPPLPVPCICSTEDHFTSKPFVALNNVRIDSITCGDTLSKTLECNGRPYTFGIRYDINSLVQGQCNGTDSVVIKDASGLVLNIATNNITSSVGISSIMVPANTFTQNGTYSVTFYLKKNGIVCSQCTMYFNVQCADVPCTSCKKTLTQAKLTTTQTNGTTSAGNISFTTGVTVQQVTMSIANIKYKWNIPGCQGDCKTPTNERACILPTGNNQTVGTLQWSDFTSTNVNNVAVNKCLEELKWNNDNSAALVAGTYNIPFSINLPKPLIEGCCKLEVEKLCIRLRFKDINCNLCDTVICLDSTQVKNDCCAESSWKKQIYTKPGNTTTQQNFKTIGTEIPKDNSACKTGMPCDREFKKDCGDTINITLGAKLKFSGIYQCNPNMTACNSTVEIKLSKQNGVLNPAFNQNEYYTFNTAGIYEVEYIGACGENYCDKNKCKHYIKVEQNCCPTTTTSTGNDSIFVSNFKGNISKQILTSPLSTPTSTLKTYSSCGNVTVKMGNYNCLTGCIASYEWKRSRKNAAGQYIQLSGAAGVGTGSSILTFGQTPEGSLDRITISLKCGDKSCKAIQIFDLKNCIESSTQSPNIDLGTLNQEVELPACTNCENNNNKIVNGDFEAGNTGFSNQLIYNPSVWDLPNYNVATNTYPFINTLLGNGKYLVVHSYYNHTGQLYGKTVWKTTNTIPVTQNKNYSFCFNMVTAWAANDIGIQNRNYGDPNLRVDVLINNQLVLHNARVGTLNVVDYFEPGPDGSGYNNTKWKQFNVTWNANASTSATIEIRFVDMALIPIGFGVKPDYPIVSRFTFGLDDIVFKECK